MSNWQTDRQTLDPGITRLVLAGRRDPAAHIVIVREWDAKRARERLLATATLWLLVTLGVSAVAWLWRR